WLSAGAPAGPSAAPAPNATATDALPVLAGTFDRAEAEAFVRGRRYTPGLETALLRQIAAADPVPATTAALP
ncbi:hypothetical protein JMJ94_06455, partial [Rhodovulum visakhapatnamense]|uniref:hypothetical protein n=1 Tax=Rhodovulum visakhapatnamense TaxID=364297 RepID=UPI00192327BD